MFTTITRHMTKSQTSNKTSNAEVVRQLSGITNRKSVPSVTGSRYGSKKEFDPDTEHDEMLTRLSEIKAFKDELEAEEKQIKSNLRKELLASEEDGDIPEIHHTLDEKLYVGFRKTDTYEYSPKLEQRIEDHAKEFKLIKNKKDFEKLNGIAKVTKTSKSVVLYRP